MNATTTVQVSAFQAIGNTVGWSLRFAVLAVIYFILFAAGGGLVAPYLPTTLAEPGPLPQMTALGIVCAATVLVIMWMIHSSRWHGWKLMLSMSVAFYVVMTLVTQLEAWYFLLGVTIGPELMSPCSCRDCPLRSFLSRWLLLSWDASARSQERKHLRIPCR